MEHPVTSMPPPEGQQGLARLLGLFPSTCHDRIYLVGGSVRDRLLGRESRDLDLLAALRPEEFRDCGFRLVEGRSTAPIWFLHSPPLGTVEATPLTDPARLDDDLRSRDFTVNAMAMTLSGRLHDPLEGISDLQSGLLRACSPRCFRDDPLRVFRAFRFEAEGWRITADTQALIDQMEHEGAYQRIPVERFSREMLKALAAPQPERFFQRMVRHGAGMGYLPELFAMGGIPAGPLRHHPEGDLLTHSLQVLQRTAALSASPLARFCALFHDIGKLDTPPESYPAHHGHEESGHRRARPFCDRLRLPARYRTALAATCRLHGLLNKWPELRDATRLRTAEEALKAGIGQILPLIAASDKPGAAPPPDWSDTLAAAGLSGAALGMGPDLERMPPEQRQPLLIQRRIEHLRLGRPRTEKNPIK